MGGDLWFVFMQDKSINCYGVGLRMEAVTRIRVLDRGWGWGHVNDSSVSRNPTLHVTPQWC